jgi:hypothetical protein
VLSAPFLKLERFDVMLGRVPCQIAQSVHSIRRCKIQLTDRHSLTIDLSFDTFRTVQGTSEKVCILLQNIGLWFNISNSVTRPVGLIMSMVN